MKYIFLIVSISSVVLFSYTENRETKSENIQNGKNSTLIVPERKVDLSKLDFNPLNACWTLDGEEFSGYAVSYYEDGILKEKIGIWQGRKHGPSLRWFPDGHLQQLTDYQEGKVHGDKKSWSAEPSHLLLAQLQYHEGRAHGEQKLWYPTGELFKKLHLNQGREEGIQQAFRRNGALYANYEARGGRIYGLKKAALCFGLEDETIQYEK